MQQPTRPQNFFQWAWGQLFGQTPNLHIEADRSLKNESGETRLRVQIIRDFIITPRGILVQDSSFVEDNRSSLDLHDEFLNSNQQSGLSLFDRRAQRYKEEVEQLLAEVRSDLDTAAISQVNSIRLT